MAFRSGRESAYTLYLAWSWQAMAVISQIPGGVPVCVTNRPEMPQPRPLAQWNNRTAPGP